MEDVIRIAVGVEGGDDLPRPGVEDDQLRRLTRGDEETVMGLIERHGEVCLRPAQLPSRRDRLLLGVDHGHPGPTGFVDEDPSRRLALERFGVRFQGDLSDTLALERVHDGERAVAVADVDALMLGVVARVVRVVAEGDRPRRLERRTVEEGEPAVAAARHRDRLRLRHEDEPLGLLESGDALHTLSLLEVHHLEGPVAERADEEPPCRDVDGEVIDAPLDSGHRNRLDEPQWRRPRWRLRRLDGGAENVRQRQCDERDRPQINVRRR
ncbi:MAG: hypothetical protein DMF77_10825 [Acidobacteria bacterium]|nr:MAG: hypothetical protein DMF77_10825 [Acidobacteriota bacterium]